MVRAEPGYLTPRPARLATPNTWDEVPVMTVHHSITSAPTKPCKGCSETKAIDDFYFINRKPSSGSSYSNFCKICDNAKCRAYSRRVAEARKRARIAACVGFHPDKQMLDDDGRDWAWCFVIFRPLPGYVGYLVGSDGSIWSRRDKGRGGLRDEWLKLKPNLRSDGRLKATLTRDGRTENRFVHRLVAETFRGPCPPGQECRHVIFNDPTDNRLLNLRWGTKEENQEDMRCHGTMIVGSKKRDAKLAETDIPTIRALVASEVSMADIARSYRVHPSTICRTVKRELWKHVP
jgi:hypothetical protein